MRKKNEFFIYTCMWVFAVIILMTLLIQNLGDARIVNYSGIVRGATQKLVKEEMNYQPNDDLIFQIDGIIKNLQTGKGKFNLRKNNDIDYQSQLSELNKIWILIKQDIYKLRSGAEAEDLYNLSQQHFIEADKMVKMAEESSDRKLVRFIVLYGIVLVFSVCVFTIINYRSRKALEDSTYKDNLTGILNRVGFEVNAVSILHQNPNNIYCLIEFDIDDFKFLNNSYGYELGDKLLCALAHGLQKRYNSNELCARISADDFVVLAIKKPDIVDELRRIFSDILQQEILLNVSEFITFTVSGYEIKDNDEIIQSVMDKANIAHKNAKLIGKSMTIWYNEKFLEKLNLENKLKNRMRKALDNEEFKMYLQPKYNLSDLNIQSAEALVRWDIPGQGIVPPDNFVPLFERNGYIAEIDFYMLERACSYIREHIVKCGSEFSVAVNFSRVTIYQQRFYSTVIEVVERFNIPYHCIEIEITESAFNEISDVMVNKILQLQEKGFIISMDDFGSGYSSLNMLDKLPIQLLKLDREFLREYETTEKVKNVLGCVTELAHTLDMKVICEGIEKQEHVQFLQEIGCDYGQGFYFSRPIPQEEFILRYEGDSRENIKIYSSKY